MTNDEIEKELRSAIEGRLSRGWMISRRMECDVGTKRCCALGARFGVGVWTKALNAFGVSTDWYTSFVDGFDGYGIGSSDYAAYALGRRLAREYVDGVK